MFCPKCGTQLADDARFCANCGNAISNAAAPAAATPQAAAPQAPTAAAPTAAAPQATPAQPMYAQPMQAAQPKYAIPQAKPSFASVAGMATPKAGINADTLKIIVTAASAIGILAFLFLTVGTAGAFGVSAGFTGLDLIAGGKVLGASYDGDLSNLIFLVPFILIIVFTWVLKGKAPNIANIVCAALELLFVIAWSSYLKDELGSFVEMGPGVYLPAIAAIVVLIIGIVSLVKAKKN